MFLADFMLCHGAYPLGAELREPSVPGHRLAAVLAAIVSCGGHTCCLSPFVGPIHSCPRAILSAGGLFLLSLLFYDSVVIILLALCVSRVQVS